MAQVLSADLIDATKEGAPNLSSYDVICFASGIYMQKYHNRIIELVENNKFSKNQNIFFVHTCGMAIRDYAAGLKKILKEKDITCLGTFHCRGFDTFGPFGKIGGIAKGHPNAADLQRAVDFAIQISSK